MSGHRAAGHTFVYFDALFPVRISSIKQYFALFRKRASWMDIFEACFAY